MALDLSNAILLNGQSISLLKGYLKEVDGILDELIRQRSNPSFRQSLNIVVLGQKKQLPTLYGVMIVKPDPGSFPHLLVRPIGDHLLVPTWPSRWPPRAVTVKDGP
jgi:hypothetical protein